MAASLALGLLTDRDMREAWLGSGAFNPGKPPVACAGQSVGACGVHRVEVAGSTLRNDGEVLRIGKRLLPVQRSAHAPGMALLGVDVARLPAGGTVVLASLPGRTSSTLAPRRCIPPCSGGSTGLHPFRYPHHRRAADCLPPGPSSSSGRKRRCPSYRPGNLDCRYSTPCCETQGLHRWYQRPAYFSQSPSPCLDLHLFLVRPTPPAISLGLPAEGSVVAKAARTELPADGTGAIGTRTALFIAERAVFLLVTRAAQGFSHAAAVAGLALDDDRLAAGRAVVLGADKAPLPAHGAGALEAARARRVAERPALHSSFASSRTERVLVLSQDFGDALGRRGVAAELVEARMAWPGVVLARLRQASAAKTRAGLARHQERGTILQPGEAQSASRVVLLLVIVIFLLLPRPLLVLARRRDPEPADPAALR